MESAKEGSPEPNDNDKPEIIIALACAVGTDGTIIQEVLREQLKQFKFNTHTVKISKDLLEKKATEQDREELAKGREHRIHTLMDIGNRLRKEARDDSRFKDDYGYFILAMGVASIINSTRKARVKDDCKGTAVIVDSLKHEDEVKKLREIYSSNFYLFAINESKDDRVRYLDVQKGIADETAQKLCDRDKEEDLKYGQHTSKVFELADFHLSLYDWNPDDIKPGSNYENTTKKLKKKRVSVQIERILDTMFGHPTMTPTFEEYAMFMAYASALRTADLSRQVGAIIATEQNEIIATGANEVPAFGGGQYWQDGQKYDEYWDVPEGRDYMLSRISNDGDGAERGYDPNKKEYDDIVQGIVDSFTYKDYKGDIDEYKKALKKHILDSRIKDLTEYNRTVHAEMAAILSCARTGVSLNGATLYCTTLPCHNCARHAIYSGIRRIVFIEPYPKSRAIDLHSDAASFDRHDSSKKVVFESFVGIGPRRFFDLFSMQLSTGYDKKRKEADGVHAKSWSRDTATLRCQLDFVQYYQKESRESLRFAQFFGRPEELSEKDMYNASG